MNIKFYSNIFQNISTWAMLDECAQFKFLTKTCETRKSLTDYLWESIYWRNFGDMQKITGFCGGPIWPKNRSINFLWPIKTTYPSIWNLGRKSNLTCTKNAPILHHLRCCQKKFLTATNTKNGKKNISATQRTKFQDSNSFARFYRDVKR